MAYYGFVERGYPISDSSGHVTEFFLGSREGAEEYAQMLENISKSEAVIPETYSVGKSVAVYKEIVTGEKNG